MLLALPILLPLLTAVVLHLLPQRSQLLRTVAFVGSICALAAAVAIFVRVDSTGIQVLQVASWPAPFGNQWPVKSGWPSARRGAGPPGGSGLIAYSVGLASWAPTDSDNAPQSVTAIAHATP